MRMKLLSGLVMAMAIGATAHAAQFVQNGNFSSVSNVPSGFGGSFEYDPNAPSGSGIVNNWQVVSPAGQFSYDILFNTANATTTQPDTRFPGEKQYLWALPSVASAAAVGITYGANTNIMALDGANVSPNAVQGELQQQINGLHVGQTYVLTFDFAGAQLQDRTGATTDLLNVSMIGASGTQSFQTDSGVPLNDASQSATGWELETFTFVASDSSELLKFLAVGTPNGDPPMALLDNVSLTGPGGVPEPATWGLMIVGVAAVGASLRRRRAMAFA